MSKSPFFFLGLFLVVLAIAIFPIKQTLQIEPSPLGETEDMRVGWLFAPVVAAWGFASLSISSMQTKSGVFRFGQAPCLFLLVLGSGYAFWMAASYGANTLFWWIQFALMITTTLLAAALVVLQFKAPHMMPAFNLFKIKWALFGSMFAVPLIFLVSSVYWWFIVV